MPLPAQPLDHHRVLFRAQSELPDSYEVNSQRGDWDGVLRHFMKDGEWDGAVIAADFAAARFGPADCFAFGIERWNGGPPADFLPAPTLAQKWAGKGDDDDSHRGLTVTKTDDGRMFVAGICYEAGVKDTDGEFMTQPELASFAQSLMTIGSRKADTDHDREDREGLTLVESAMVGIEKGEDSESYRIDSDGEGWFVKYEVVDPAVKARIELEQDDKRSLNAFSWDGLVRKRTSTVTKSEAVHACKAEDFDLESKGDDDGVELYDGRCLRVSLVHRGANRRMFATATKSADADELLAAPPPAEPAGFMARLKAFIGGTSEDNPLGGADSLDDALKDFAWQAREALSAPDASSQIAHLATALGRHVAAKADKALTTNTDTRGSFFTPARSNTSEDIAMTKDELQALIKSTVAEANKAQEPPAEEPPPADDDVSTEDAVKAAIEATAKAKADEIAAKDAEIAALKAKVAVPAPSAGGDPPAGGNGTQTPAIKWGDINAERRRQNTLKYRMNEGAK